MRADGTWGDIPDTGPEHAGMNRVGGDPPSSPPAHRLQGEEDVGELRVRIRLKSAPPGPAPGDVVEARPPQRAGAMNARTDVHDASASGFEALKEQAGELKVAQVVGGESQFEPVRRQSATPLKDSGVVDQDVDRGEAGGDAVGDPADVVLP